MEILPGTILRRQSIWYMSKFWIPITGFRLIHSGCRDYNIFLFLVLMFNIFLGFLRHLNHFFKLLVIQSPIAVIHLHLTNLYLHSQFPIKKKQLKLIIKRIKIQNNDSQTCLSHQLLPYFSLQLRYKWAWFCIQIIVWITCSWFDYVSQGRSSAPYISQGTQIRQSFWTKSRNLLHMASLQNQTVRLPSYQNQTISTSPKVPKPNHLNISQGTKTNPSQHLPSSRNQTISTSPK